MTGSGVRAGTKGVVLDRRGSHLVVRFDAGWGSHTARIHIRDCRVYRRGRGEPAFARRTHVLTVVRSALAIFLVWPVVWFALGYVWDHRSAEGLIAALAAGFGYGLLDYVEMALAHPLQFTVYVVFLSVLGRVAFPR